MGRNFRFSRFFTKYRVLFKQQSLSIVFRSTHTGLAFERRGDNHG